MSIYSDPVKGPGIFTRSGNVVFPLDPDPNTIELSDIGYHLAYINRFGGAAGFINVLSHSLNCYDYAEAMGASWSLRLAMLLHDAPEYVLGDMISPLKYGTAMGKFYEPVEQQLATMIFDKFLGHNHPVRYDDSNVKQIDDIILATEIKMFLPQFEMPDGLPEPLTADVFTYVNHKPGHAKFRFTQICQAEGLI